MKKRYLIFAVTCLAACGQPKSYLDEIAEYRQSYKEGFLTDERAPLTAADTGYLRFYEPNEKYRVTAQLELTPNAKEFEIPTVSGQTKTYRKYAIAKFNVNNTPVELSIYQSLKLIQQREYKDHLFLPFTDGTTGGETYGGGRYLDLSKEDIKNNTIVLDFNKSYNPWCAFGDGYSCPVPPKENRLRVLIEAGEKNYAKGFH